MDRQTSHEIPSSLFDASFPIHEEADAHHAVPLIAFSPEAAQEAATYAATPQLSTPPAAALPPHNSTLQQEQEQHHQQQQQQQREGGPSDAQPQQQPAFVALSALPTFELPEEAHIQQERELDGVAAAAATMSALHTSDAQEAAAAATHGANGIHTDGSAMQIDAPSPTAADAAAPYINGVSTSHQSVGPPAAAAAIAAATGRQGHARAATAAAGVSAAAGPAALNVLDQLLPPINASTAAALAAGLQHEDDQQLLQEAAAVGASTQGPTAAAAAGLPASGSGSTEPQLWQDEGWEAPPQQQQQQHLAAATQLGQLGLQDINQGQQQQHVQQQQQQQRQRQGAGLEAGGQGPFNLSDLLQPLPGPPDGMDLDAAGAGDIPVLQQPQQRQQVDADDAFLPPHLCGRSRSRVHADILPEGEGAGSSWGSQGPAGEAAAAAAEGGDVSGGEGEGEGVSGVSGAGEGIGPNSFGLPFEAVPVLPDEPVRLVHVPENPADSYLL